MDKEKILHSFYGYPLTPFLLYPGCDYLFNDALCEYIVPIPDTEGNRLQIRLKSDGQYYTVDRVAVAPIPLRSDRMDQLIDIPSKPLPNGDLEWESKDPEKPFTIRYNGRYFTYSNPKLMDAGEYPIPVFFLSDLQAVRLGLES